MAAKSLFLEVSSLTPERAVTIMEKIRQARSNTNTYIYNVILTSVSDPLGHLYEPTLDAVAPYFPWGPKPAMDNLFVGSGWVPWSPDKYQADKTQWQNHYAVWGGILNSQYRWDNISLAYATWRAFKDRYQPHWMHFYLSPEADLGAFIHPTLGVPVRQAYEALLIELCRKAKSIEPHRSVSWSPFHWTPFRQQPLAARSQLHDALRTLFLNVEQYSGQGITFLDMQDSVGARPGVILKEDADELFNLIRGTYPFPSLRMNCEWFTVTPAGLAPDPSAGIREAWYISKDDPIGACWEARWWVAAQTIPGPQQTEFLTREQWGARTDLPRLGYHVPASRRTELHVHHTASVDANDTTPNRWSRTEAIGYMRRLQTARPDLGLDIPYNRVFFVLEDLTVLICEGRGEWRTGAHTAGHNTAGFGWSVGGNFDQTDTEARIAFLSAVENEARFQKANGFPNLCTVKSPKGWDVWGHRDTAPKSCPGNTLYPSLAAIKI